MKFIIENREWNDEQCNQFVNLINKYGEKIVKTLSLVSPIIIILLKGNEEKNERGMYDEGKIILYSTSPDAFGDFIHELGHQLVRINKISYNAKAKLINIQNKMEKEEGDGRIFTNEHTYKNAKEVFSTIFKWYVMGKIIDEGFIEVLNNFIDDGEKIVESILKNEEIMKSIPSKIIFKSRQVKYKSKKFVNGKWIYEYEDKTNGRNKSVEEKIETLKEWFGNSLVKSDDGKPLIVYHGTNLDFNEFDKSKSGKNYRESEGGIFFTNKKKSAENYAKLHSYNKDNSDSEKNGLVINSVLKIENPIIEYAEDYYGAVEKYDRNYHNYIKDANDNGNDGVIIYSNTGNLYVVLNKEQVKIIKKEKVENNVFKSIRVLNQELHEEHKGIQGDNGKVINIKQTTFSGHKIKGKVNWKGMTISIENRKGDIRRGVDPNGIAWETKMSNPYGYINGTKSNESGDHLDCFLGEKEDTDKIFVVKIQDPETKIFDEDKAFLKFGSEKAVLNAFRRNYDKQWKKRIKDIKIYDIERFKEMVLSGKIDL